MNGTIRSGIHNDELEEVDAKLTGQDVEDIEDETDPMYLQKVAVDSRFFMARLALEGGRNMDAAEFAIDLFRKKDVQRVKVRGSNKS